MIEHAVPVDHRFRCDVANSALDSHWSPNHVAWATLVPNPGEAA